MYELSQHYPWLMPSILLLGVVACIFAVIFNDSAKKAEEAHAAKNAAKVTDVTAKEKEAPVKASVAILDPELAPGLRQSHIDGWVKEFLASEDETFVVDLRPFMGSVCSDLSKYLELQRTYINVANVLEHAILKKGYDYTHGHDLSAMAEEAIEKVGVVWSGPLAQKATGAPGLHQPAYCHLPYSRIRSRVERTRSEFHRSYAASVLGARRDFKTLAADESLGVTKGHVVQISAFASLRSRKLKFIGPMLDVKSQQICTVTLPQRSDVEVEVRATPGGIIEARDELFLSRLSGEQIVRDLRMIDNYRARLIHSDQVPHVEVHAVPIIAVPMLTEELLGEVAALQDNNSFDLHVYRGKHFLNVEFVARDKTILVSDQSAFFYRTDDFRDAMDNDRLITQLIALYGHNPEGDRIELKTDDNHVVWHVSPAFKPAETPALAAA